MVCSGATIRSPTRSRKQSQSSFYVSYFTENLFTFAYKTIFCRIESDVKTYRAADLQHLNLERPKNAFSTLWWHVCRMTGYSASVSLEREIEIREESFREAQRVFEDMRVSNCWSLSHLRLMFSTKPGNHEHVCALFRHQQCVTARCEAFGKARRYILQSLSYIRRL